MREGLFRVENDLYSIAERLREIDGSYELYRDAARGGYRLYSGGAQVCALPYDAPDCRMLEHARRTRRERADEIAAEVERANAAADAENEKRAREYAAEIAERAVSRRYAECEKY